MMPRRRVGTALLGPLVAALFATNVRSEDAAERATNDALKKAVAYLMSQPGEDGGWHSQTYGSLQQGAAVTAFALYALSHVPDELLADHRPALQRGYDFLQIGIRERGFVCNPDGTPDFPNYGSAVLLTAARRLKLKMPADDEQKLVAHLIAAQISETREFTPDNPHYGGWDLVGPLKVLKQTSGTNVSLGCFILEALAESEHPDLKTTLPRARIWAGRCQQFPGDGGFCFTPDAGSDGNKAQFEKDPDDETKVKVRSYGTTTCDGLLCLLYAGTDKNNERVRAAVRWLVDHPTVKVVPGFEAIKPSTDWESGLRYYYYAGLVKVLPLFPEKEADATRRKLVKQLVADQRQDGSWQNSSARMREDDPLICTSMAIIALAEIVKAKSK